MSTAMSIVRTLLGLLFDHTIGNIVRMIPIIRLPKLERGPVSRGFLALLLGILFFGLTMLFSASYSSAYATSGKLYSIIKPQVMIAIVGLFFMWVLSNINYRALRLMSESLYIITVVLLILTLLSPEDTNGTYRWVYLPGGASFQPSELAKFSLMLWTADMLDRDYDKKNRLWYGAIKPALPLLLILYLLHKESHNSGMILLCLIFATMLVCTLSPGRWLLLLIPAGVVVGAYFLKGLAGGEGYAAGRMDSTWGLAPLDTAGMLWQTRQSIYAISTGGMFGVGIGASVQKHQWLPYAENDFIFGVIGEELGNDVIAFPEPWMASESFSQLQKLWPGVFALLGINNPEKGTGAAHHNEYFDLDEDVFKLGVAGAVTYALRFLDGDVDTSSRQWKGSVRDLFTELGIKPEVIDSYYKAIHE